MRFISLALLTACGGSFEEAPSSLEPLHHDVEYEVEEGVARLLVRRAFRGVEGQLELEIPLPSAGAVDRFRFGFNDRWYEGELLEADAATERYHLLSGLAGEEGHAIEGAPPPALLAYQGEGFIRLQAHPVKPEDTLEVEYRITLPTCHMQGRAWLDYPFDPSDPATFSGPGGLREPTEEEVGCDPEASILESDRIVIELDPVPELFLSYALQPLGERTAVRIAIDAPPELAPIPERPSVVFVMDGSYSQEDSGLVDQLAWARAYLEWVPDAEVEVVVFRREAERLFGRFVPARDFADAIASLPGEKRALGNGSFLDRGVALANEALNGRGGETRVVVTSDLWMRSAFAPAIVEPGSAIMHLLQRFGPGDGAPWLEVPGRHYGRVISPPYTELAELVSATGGLFRTLYGDPTDPDAIAVAEELVHPVRLDAIEVMGLDDLTHEEELDRGAAMRTTALLGEGNAPDRIEVRGKLWSRDLSFEVPRSTVVEGAMPAILVATARALSREELLHVARIGGVVSSETSYLAELGGVDPVEMGTLTGGWGIGGFGVGSSHCGCCRMSGKGAPVDDSWLREAVLALVETCRARDASIVVETTLHEIADVTVTASQGEDCLREAIWTLRLPEEFLGYARTQVSISL